jgi:hypothetical protein
LGSGRAGDDQVAEGFEGGAGRALGEVLQEFAGVVGATAYVVLGLLQRRVGPERARVSARPASSVRSESSNSSNLASVSSARSA